VRRVLELQWRGIVIVLVIIADVIFFAVVFVFLDDIEQTLLHDPLKGAEWLSCLITSGGNKTQCLKLAEHLVVGEATVMAVLLLLSVCTPLRLSRQFSDQMLNIYRSTAYGF
jgi:hypothetical protein